jgi:xanthine dehydrogenase YagR molybdenum-binding subunit
MTARTVRPEVQLGRPTARVDGRLKVTGQARYAADRGAAGLLHAVALTSTIAAGRIRAIDARAAERAPGVLAVITHLNAPRMPQPAVETPQNRFSRAVPVLQDATVRHHGQFVGVVVAVTQEQARQAARLVRIDYEAQPPRVDFDAHAEEAYAPKIVNAGVATDSKRGDVAAAMGTAARKVVAVYDTPIEHHHPMEPHATVAEWQGDRLTVHHGLQMVVEAPLAIAATFDIPPDNVRVHSPFVGGGFGCKILTRENAMLAILAARVARKPVKLVLTRQQMFMAVGLRQHNRQSMQLGAAADGALVAIRHDTLTHTSMHEEFVEQSGVMARMMYAAPNVEATHRVFRLHVQTPKWTRAPGEAPGSFALESAVDELAAALDVDPVELRIRNDTPVDADAGKPFASRALVECLRAGAERVGWAKRPRTPRATRSGEGYIGLGVAAASRGAPHRACSAGLVLEREGRRVRARIEMAGTDIGTGTYTIVAQAAADALRVPLAHIEVRLGDSSLPPTPGSGGSWGAGNYVAATLAVCEQAMATLQARSSLRFIRPPSAAELMQAAGESRYATTAESKPPGDWAERSHYAFGAHFCEVWVDEALGIVRIPRFTSVIAAGHILNPMAARSQIVGGIVWGIGNALMEESLLEKRDGAFITRTLADYHVPCHADIGEIDVIFLPEEDRHVNRVGVKGIGEIGIIGVAAAVANAVYHATGRRVRSLPITPDKLITA